MSSNPNAETEEYEAKQKELETMFNPIAAKLYQGAEGAGGMPGMPGGMPGGMGGMPGGMGGMNFGGAPGAPGAAGSSGPSVDEVD